MFYLQIIVCIQNALKLSAMEEEKPSQLVSKQLKNAVIN